MPMVRTSKVRWVVAEDLAGAGARLARHVAACARRSVRARGSFHLVLAGGETPRALHSALVHLPKGAVPWRRTWVYWGDDRLVGPKDPDSNYGMARSTLLSLVPIPPAQVRRIRGELRPTRAAVADYERTLGPLLLAANRRPAFDLVLLGMGPDCHTASLFPGSPLLRATRPGVSLVPVSPDPPHRARATLTLPALRSSREICFLIAGASKAAALRAIAARLPRSSARYPASLLLGGEGPPVRFYLDREAARRLPSDLKVEGRQR